MVDLETGYLIADDSVLDKRFSRNNELVGKHWSGNEHRLISGISEKCSLWQKSEVLKRIMCLETAGMGQRKT